MSKIRNEDKPYLNEVVQYLQDRGLSVELRGSALEREDYEDIDVLATGELEAVTDAISGLQGCAARGTPFPKNSADDPTYFVADLGKRVVYMRENLTHRFKILVSNLTKIDVGLKINKVKIPLGKDTKLFLSHDTDDDGLYEFGLETKF